MNKILRKIRKIFYLNQIRLGPRFGRLLTILILRILSLSSPFHVPCISLATKGKNQRSCLTIFNKNLPLSLLQVFYLYSMCILTPTKHNLISAI